MTNRVLVAAINTSTIFVACLLLPVAAANAN